MTDEQEYELDPVTAEILEAVTKEHYSTMLSADETVERKAQSMLGFSGVIISLVTAGGQWILNHQTTTTLLLYVLSASCFVLCALFLLRTTRIEEYHTFAEPENLFNAYWHLPPNDARHCIIRDRQLQVTKNGKLFRYKSRLVESAQILFVLGTVFLLGTILARIADWAGVVVIVACLIVYWLLSYRIAGRIEK